MANPQDQWGKNNSFYGRKHTPETIQKLRDFQAENNLKACRACVSGHFIEFPSVKAMAEYFSITPGQMSKVLRGKRKLPQKYIDQGIYVEYA